MDLNHIEIQIETLKDSHTKMWESIIRPAITTLRLGTDARDRIEEVSDKLAKIPNKDSLVIDNGTLSCLVLLAEFGLNAAVIRGAEEKLITERIK